MYDLVLKEQQRLLAAADEGVDGVEPDTLTGNYNGFAGVDAGLACDVGLNRKRQEKQ